MLGAKVPQMSKPMAECQWSAPIRGRVVSGWRWARENPMRKTPRTATAVMRAGKNHDDCPRRVRPPPVRATLATFLVEDGFATGYDPTRALDLPLSGCVPQRPPATPAPPSRPGLQRPLAPGQPGAGDEAGTDQGKGQPSRSRGAVAREPPQRPVVFQDHPVRRLVGGGGAGVDHLGRGLVADPPPAALEAPA